jgi:hypothetical protein
MHPTRNRFSLAAAIIIASLSSAQAFAMGMPFHGIAAGLGIGTEGVGVQGTTAIIPKILNLNVGFDYLHLSHSFHTSNVNYKAGINLQGEPITVSWFPFQGNFNVTAGVFINQNGFSLSGTPTGGTYTFNGHTYKAKQVGRLSGKTHFNGAAPYVGLGYGDPMDGGRLTFTANVGAIYEGAPNLSLNATGAASNPQLASDVQTEQAKVNSKVSGYQWWPVMGMGLMYRFG